MDLRQFLCCFDALYFHQAGSECRRERSSSFTLHRSSHDPKLDASSDPCCDPTGLPMVAMSAGASASPDCSEIYFKIQLGGDEQRTPVGSHRAVSAVHPHVDGCIIIVSSSFISHQLPLLVGYEKPAMQTLHTLPSPGSFKQQSLQTRN